MKLCVALFVILITLQPLGGATASDTSESSPLKFSPIFDLRVRQEILENVLYFTPEPSRQWLRIRTRAGVKAQNENHELNLRLVNEHRRLQVPEPDEFNWGEVIIDQLFWAWSPDRDTKLTLGRQNIIWDGGFLVLEGHPLDGSRSIYMNGLRYRKKGLDVFAVYNWKKDPFVLIDDQDLNLSDANETGLGAKVPLGNHQLALIWKMEDDPDNVLPLLNTYTVSGRFKFGQEARFKKMFELALQYQAGIPDNSPDLGYDGATTDGVALAAQGKIDGPLTGSLEGDLGFFYYSGNGNDLNSFRTPWGRWPKWSELYIYTLLGEGGDGRVHVAAWENIAAPRMNLQLPLLEDVKARLGLAYLLAPQPDWQARGLLVQTELKFDLLKGLDGHLLWEILDPGSFHDTAAGAAKTAHFLRWQLNYAFN